MDGRTQAQQKREARIRAGTQAPGPKPRGSQGDPALVPGENESLDRLAGDFCLFQRRDGHRYSTDDLLCAYFACECLAESQLLRGEAPDLAARPFRVLDLGSGIGSVPLFLSWRLESASIVGVEAQEISHALAQRSIRYNGVEARVSIGLGDLRDHAALPRENALVTGTPPYFETREGVVSDKPQRGPCRFELRGGVEDYLDAMSYALSPEGVAVLVQPWRDLERMRTHAASQGLQLARYQPVVFKEGRAPLIGLFSFRRAAKAEELPALVVRRADGSYSDEFRAARVAMGFPREGGF
jgi:tRNA1(Val) A37 N6-methylase TrmN6